MRPSFYLHYLDFLDWGGGGFLKVGVIYQFVACIITDEESEDEAAETSKPKQVKKKQHEDEDVIVDVEGSGGEEEQSPQSKGAQPGKGEGSRPRGEGEESEDISDPEEDIIKDPNTGEAVQLSTGKYFSPGFTLGFKQARHIKPQRRPLSGSSSESSQRAKVHHLFVSLLESG